MVEILEHMSALSDPTRCRMLLILEKHELTVSELCAVLQMPQSSVSRQLKTLADDKWVSSRRDATSRYYTMPLDDLDSAATRLWPLIREQVASTTAAAHDERRLRGVLDRRRATSQEFFATAAGKWDRLREGLFGDTFYLWAVLGLIDPTLTVGDLGHLDEQGRLFVDAREDDMIVSGGENVYPGEVEAVLRRGPGVEEAVVLGVPDERFGQRLAAFVVPSPGSALSAEELEAFARENLARFKVPREFRVVDELPRNATGKVLRRKLKEQLSE